MSGMVLSSTIRANDIRHNAGVEKLIGDYLEQNTISRNARLALLKHYSLASIRDNSYQDKLVSACWEHFSDYSTRVVCFRDLHPYLPHLETSKQKELLEMTASTARGYKTRVNESEVSICTLAGRRVCSS